MKEAILRIAELGVLPVINIPKPELAVPLAEALIRGGIDAMEVTLRSDIALASLERIHAAHPEMLLCAGTVRAPAQAREAVAAGARCIVAPGMRADVAEVCAGLEVPYMAACVTGTEIETALDFGMNLVKFFPAEPMGGAEAVGRAVSSGAICSHRRNYHGQFGGISFPEIRGGLRRQFYGACGHGASGGLGRNCGALPSLHGRIPGL